MSIAGGGSYERERGMAQAHIDSGRLADWAIFYELLSADVKVSGARHGDALSTWTTGCLVLGPVLGPLNTC